LQHPEDDTPVRPLNRRASLTPDILKSGAPPRTAPVFRNRVVDLKFSS